MIYLLVSCVFLFKALKMFRLHIHVCKTVHVQNRDVANVERVWCSSKATSVSHCRLWPGEDVFEPEFEANSQEFQELAVGVIDVCYKTDHELAKRLVEQKSMIWRGKTRMDVAVLANCKFFLATACVQACVEGYWKGNLRCKVRSLRKWPAKVIDVHFATFTSNLNR